MKILRTHICEIADKTTYKRATCKCLIYFEFVTIHSANHLGQIERVTRWVIPMYENAIEVLIFRYCRILGWKKGKIGYLLVCVRGSNWYSDFFVVVVAVVVVVRKYFHNISFLCYWWWHQLLKYVHINQKIRLFSFINYGSH